MDLVPVVDEAIAQVPPQWRSNLLVTSDTAGASHELIGPLIEIHQTGELLVPPSRQTPDDAAPARRRSDTQAGTRDPAYGP